MTLTTARAAAADHLLAEFGESVTYTPTGGAPAARSITAVIDRRQPGPLDGVPHGGGPDLTATVKNDVTTGITAAEVDTGGDTISVARRIGETPVARRITKIISQDSAMLTLELR